jgi:hypothetical protein
VTKVEKLIQNDKNLQKEIARGTLGRAKIVKLGSKEIIVLTVKERNRLKPFIFLEFVDPSVTSPVRAPIKR